MAIIYGQPGLSIKNGFPREDNWSFSKAVWTTLLLWRHQKLYPTDMMFLQVSPALYTENLRFTWKTWVYKLNAQFKIIPFTGPETMERFI